MPTATEFRPGAIVECRDRPWIVLPSRDPGLILLRPLSGNEAQICGLIPQLEFEELESASFPLPDPRALQDSRAAQLLLAAARLSLRSGAGPFRCLGRLSVRPRPYQLVPLLMALRLPTVRLLIADDVGVGKTIEAGLIARELLDRGEVQRLAVLCPPQLCDQWHAELKRCFHIDAAIARSGTVAKLERQLPPGNHHIFGYFQHLIVSLDYAKSDRRCASFLAHCPDLVIVDEAHTCTDAGSGPQQLRHRLVQKIAQRPGQHLILLTATPHSGIEAAFLSLLGLLKPGFDQLNLDQLTTSQRSELAKHFVQRRRADVRQWLGDETPFPERDASEEPYTLSPEYRQLFQAVYDFARGLVRSAGDELSYAQRRGRYWSALAIIRCVMSSPAAAIATLSRQVANQQDALGSRATPDSPLAPPDTAGDLDDDLAATYVYDLTEVEQSSDVAPAAVVQKGQQTYSDRQRRQLREFVKQAAQLQGQPDRKLQAAIARVQEFLKAGYNPILWCRYIATAEYLAAALRQELEPSRGSQVRVIAITGAQSEDERLVRLEELANSPQRVMVATDCLSEGVNLQAHFNAVLHYDLPWNPNRLEQREGRIDRYGQTTPRVQSVLLYGQDNPVDGAVLEVLIRKAVKIHKTLGITVPVPMDSNTVQEAVFKSLFERAGETDGAVQLTLFADKPSATTVQERWDRAVEKEKLNRTRFAQRAIKPAEVQQELQESDRALGSVAEVERFVQAACDRLGGQLQRCQAGWQLVQVPACVQALVGEQARPISFVSPAPAGAEYIGRNHPLVEGMAQYLLETALEGGETPAAARCGLTITRAVQQPTVVLLLRLRHLLTAPRRRETAPTPILAEECLARGFTGPPSQPQWLPEDAIQALLAEAQPDGDLPFERKKRALERLRDRLEDLQPALEAIAQERAAALAAAHRRVRSLTQESQVNVEPQLPMDILGLYLFQAP